MKTKEKLLEECKQMQISAAKVGWYLNPQEWCDALWECFYTPEALVRLARADRDAEMEID